jgi:trimethylguanosine synthase
MSKKRRRTSQQSQKGRKSGDSLNKYWYQRYQLFSRFDEGIELDEESWYSVTPEQIARHIAMRCYEAGAHIVMDAFSGAGGNVIQFAHYCQRVVAVDIDQEKIRMARHNAKIYGVESKIQSIHADVMALDKKHFQGVDLVFMSPPWGGPDYLQQEFYSIESLQPVGGKVLIEHMLKLCPNLVLFLPRNTDLQELMAALPIPDTIPFTIEQNYLNGKYKTLTVYIGHLFENDR